MGAAASSPAPALLPEDVIMEILLRVPPEPIYLHRASLVCRKWRDLIRDPAFLRRFRARHRHTAPLVGFFRENGSFVPTGEAPDRVSSKHFSQLHGASRWSVFGSRHGRVLLSAGRQSWEKLDLLVWDPMTGHRTYISPPRNVLLGFPAANGLTYYERPDPLVQPPCVRAALVCNHDGDDVEDDCQSRPFRVVLMFPNTGTMFACVYSSETGAWGAATRVLGRFGSISHWEPNSVLAANVLYWPELHGTELLGYDLGTNRFQHVLGFHSDDDPFDCVQVFRAADGELRLAAALESNL